MFTVVEDYLLTRDRICNEKLGLCKQPVITEINLQDVVKNILATKPASLQNDDYIQNMYD
jgi:sphingomyelin phosphodiesterase